MILHLIRYDPKFPQLVRQRFEAAAPGSNVFVVVKIMEHQKNTLGEVFLYVSTADELATIVESRSDWEAVIVNGLLAELWPYRDVIPAGLPKAYYVWGVEGYNAVVDGPRALFEPVTAKLACRPRSRLRHVFYRLSGRLGRLRRRTKEMGHLFDFGLFPIKEEVALFAENGILSKDIEYLRGNVGVGFDFNNPPFNLSCSGNDILVGNSAHPNNNHLDTFLWLRKQRFIDGRKIIVPLSYGGPELYRQKVIESGRQLFGDQFTPLLELMPRESYMALMKSCCIVVMNHRRQQGAGNVFLSLALGATVYLQHGTTLARGLLDLGFAVKEIGVDLKEGQFSLIDEEMRVENIRLSKKYISCEQCVEQTRVLLQRLRQRYSSQIIEEIV